MVILHVCRIYVLTSSDTQFWTNLSRRCDSIVKFDYHDTNMYIHFLFILNPVTVSHQTLATRNLRDQFFLEMRSISLSRSFL